MSKTAYKYKMSAQCRRPAHIRNSFLSWINDNPKFKERRPTPDEVVKEARKKNSPIHCIIEQDIKKAALQQWRAEAQYLLRHVEVIRIKVTTGEELTRPVKAYIPVKINRDGSIDEENYVPSQRLANMSAKKRSVIERARADFRALIERYERYEEFLNHFSPVVAAYREVEDRLAAEDAA